MKTNERVGEVLRHRGGATHACEIEAERRLFRGLILLVLSVALFAVRAISEEERNVSLRIDEFLCRHFSLFSGIELAPVCVLVLIQKKHLRQLLEALEPLAADE